MDNQAKCDKYEAYFIFQSEEAFYEHLKNCPDCQKEHEKYMKVSALLKEAAPSYLKKKQKTEKGIVKKLACCFVLFTGLMVFTGYKVYDNCSFQVNTAEESCISTQGLPVDEYGLLEI